MVKTLVDSNKTVNDLKDIIKAKDNSIEELKTSVDKIKFDFEQQRKVLNLKTVEIKEKTKLFESIKVEQEKKDIEDEIVMKNLMNKIGNLEKKIKHISEQNNKKSIELKNEKAKIIFF